MNKVSAKSILRAKLLDYVRNNSFLLSAASLKPKDKNVSGVKATLADSKKAEHGDKK